MVDEVVEKEEEDEEEGGKEADDDDLGEIDDVSAVRARTRLTIAAYFRSEARRVER